MVHSNLPVTVVPGSGLDGKPVNATPTSAADPVTVIDAWLLAALGSLMALVLPVTVMVWLAAAV